MEAGLALALASAAALNWGYFVQHGAAAALPPLTLRRPFRSLAMLFADWRWLGGFTMGIGGWVLYVAALRLAPLSLVQATSAGGIGLLALLVRRVTATPLARRELIGVVASVVGLALLGASLGGGTPTGTHGTVLWIAVWVGASALTAALVTGGLRRLLAPGAALGIAAGLLYAAGDVATKAAVPGGGRLLFVPVLLACHGLAFVALQLGFQRGGALATAGVATLFTNALPIAAGAFVFAETLPGGAASVLRVLAFGLTVAGAALLAAPERQARLDRISDPNERFAQA
ncbi:MAG: hypothetical protein WBB74_00175 [Gaiellaceae bacterium]